MGIFLVLPATAQGKPVFKIAFLIDASRDVAYHKVVENEINSLLESRYDIKYLTQKMDPGKIGDENAILLTLMGDSSIDCIIGLGLDISQALVQYKNYPKPVIAGTILDRKLQGLPLTPEGNSGIHNFNYIQSPFDIEKDLTTFKKLYNYKHLAILFNAREISMFHTLYSYFGKAVEKVSPAAKLSIVEIATNDIEKNIAGIPDRVDAIYVLPLFMGDNKDEQKTLIQAINHRKLPSFALIGEDHVRMGAMASIAPDRNIHAMARRVAINVLDIAGGQDAGKLPVIISKQSDNFVVNVGTCRQIDYYPAWTSFSTAHLLNLDGSQQGPKRHLRGVIGEALERNLSLQMEKMNTEIQTREVGVARASRLPSMELSTAMNRIDNNRISGTVTDPARATWTASGTLSQSIFSDDILANHAIQQILLESQKYQEKATLMDTVVTAANAYITLLFARSNRIIQNDNLDVTRKNLDISRNKASVGSVDASEVYRWESELASNQISLNDAYRDLQLARMSLNEILDRPIGQPIAVEDIEPGTAIELLITDPGVYQYLGNFKQLSRFSDFLITEADRNLPELQQIKETRRSREREVLNKKRSFYLPDVQLSGSVDKILDEYDVGTQTPSDLDHPWILTVAASWPLLTGGARKEELAKSRLKLRQVRLEEKNLQNQQHFKVRSSLETAAVSAREIQLSKQGLTAARKNFNIIQAGYAEGRNTIADLIDAQNASLSSELGAQVARYQFVLDFLELERAMGRFHFLEPPGKKNLFLVRLREHMETTK